LSGLQNIGQDN
jgi:hypothetical protein